MSRSCEDLAIDLRQVEHGRATVEVGYQLANRGAAKQLALATTAVTASIGANTSIGGSAPSTAVSISRSRAPTSRVGLLVKSQNASIGRVLDEGFDSETFASTSLERPR